MQAEKNVERFAQAAHQFASSGNQSSQQLQNREGESSKRKGVVLLIINVYMRHVIVYYPTPSHSDTHFFLFLAIKSWYLSCTRQKLGALCWKNNWNI